MFVAQGEMRRAQESRAQQTVQDSELKKRRIEQDMEQSSSANAQLRRRVEELEARLDVYKVVAESSFPAPRPTHDSNSGEYNVPFIVDYQNFQREQNIVPSRAESIVKVCIACFLHECMINKNIQAVINLLWPHLDPYWLLQMKVPSPRQNSTHAEICYEAVVRDMSEKYKRAKLCFELDGTGIRGQNLVFVELSVYDQLTAQPIRLSLGIARTRSTTGEEEANALLQLVRTRGWSILDVQFIGSDAAASNLVMIEELTRAKREAARRLLAEGRWKRLPSTYSEDARAHIVLL
eukprot:TRINITY_DN2447_c0_g1_i5.p1 TRINITY_DN2447_c0_g1~~TRINITY_DN2447_c0_g1_i5.p1  ORF type:complete len:293 (-),score=45.67 TRINITY_DN2447_c0_g1_i5:454-1332(-)